MHVTHKFLFGLRHKKIKIPSYENESEEVLLYMLREFNTLLRQHGILEDELRVEMAYEFFADTVKGDALDTWLEILQDDQVYELGIRDAISWTSHMQAFRNILIDQEAYDDQREYLRSTKKPQNLTVKNWIKRIKVINGYLPLLEVGGEKFTEEGLIRYVTKPNIPKSWVKDFKIGRGLNMTSTLEVLSLLKTIEASDTSEKNKPFKKTKSFKKSEKYSKYDKNNDKRNGKKKFKNKCCLHPQGNHEWDDCFKNPNNKKDSKDNKHIKKNNEHHHICKSKNKKTKSTKKKEDSDDSSSSDDSWSSEDEEENNAIVSNDEVEENTNKKPNTAK